MLRDFWLWLRGPIVHEKPLSRKRRAAEKLGIKTKSVREVVREMEEKSAKQGKDIHVRLNRAPIEKE